MFVCVCVQGMWGGACQHSLVCACGAVHNCHSEPKIHLAREDKGGRGRDGDVGEKEKGEHEDESRDGGGMQGRIGGRSVAQCTVPHSPFLSTLHHPEHEHFFNHSRKSGVELSGGRVSHCSVCSHHTPSPPPSPRPATHPSSRHCHATQLHLSCSPRITIPGSVLRSSHRSPAQFLFFSSLTFILFPFLLIPPLS